MDTLQFVNETFWFYTTLVLFIIVIGLLIYMTRKRYLVRISDVQGRLEVLKEYRTRLKNFDVQINVEIDDENGRSAKLVSKKDAEKERERSRFFALIAHDLRSPTAAMISSAELLMEGFSSMSDRKKKLLINSIFSSSNQLLNLIDNLLNWSSSQSKGLIPVPETFDISEVQDEIVSLLYLTSEKKRVLVNAGIPKGTNVFADKKMCSTIIRNLLNNAIKYSEFLDEIDIKLITKKEEINTDIDLKKNIVICLKDNGIGIPDEDQRRLFDEVFTSTRRGTSGEKGTGLGLTICKEFIDLNKGTIWVESEEGEGSSFFFSLPRA